MFERFRVYAALPATDLERAKRFYAEKLGLDAAGTSRRVEVRVR